MDMEFRRMAGRLAQGEDIPHGEVQWLRGWYACLKALLDQPKTAAANIERERRERKDVEP